MSMLNSSATNGSGMSLQTSDDPVLPEPDQQTLTEQPLSHLAPSTRHKIDGTLIRGPDAGGTVQIVVHNTAGIIPIEGGTTNEALVLSSIDGYPQELVLYFDTPADVSDLMIQTGSANGPWDVDYIIEPDYSHPSNAEQVGVPQHLLQYPVFEATGIPPMPEDVNVAFEDLIFTQRVFWFAQRMWNEPDYINEMAADMNIMANDFNYNTATRSRAAVNAAFMANVGNLGANETLRGYVNWILGINDGRSTVGAVVGGDPVHWEGWHGEWLSVQEWYDTIVPANFKSSLVDPST